MAQIGNAIAGLAYTAATTLTGTSTKVELPKELDSIDNRLNGTISALGSILSRTEALADRLVGAQPKSANGGQTGASTCALRRLEVDAETLSAQVTALDAELSRLERL